MARDQKRKRRDSLTDLIFKRVLPILFLLMLLLFLFSHQTWEIFRPFSRSLLRHFLAHFPYQVSLSPLFNKNIFFSLTDLFLLTILLILPFTKKVAAKDFFFQGSRKYLTFLLLSGILSLFFSLFASYYRQSIALIHLTLMLVLFHLTLTLCQDRRELIKQTLYALLALSVIECALTCYQFYFQKAVGWPLLGEPHLSSQDPSLATYVLQGERAKVILRPYGTFYHPNILGGFLSMAILLSYYAYLEATRLWQRACFYFLIPFQILSLFLTFSRGGLLSFVTSSLLSFFLLYKKEKKSLQPLITIVLSSLLVITSFCYKQLESRGGIVNYNTLSRGADRERLQDYERALAMIKLSPLTGVGYQCYTLFPDELLFLPPSPRLPHNIYLLLTSELGVIGLSCFLLFLFSLFRPYWRSRWTPLSATLVSILFGFLLIGLFDFYLLFDHQGKILFFLMAALTAAVSPQKRSASSCPFPPPLEEKRAPLGFPDQE